MSEPNFYRVGQVVYRRDQLIGIMDCPDHAEMVTESLNARERVLAARGTAPVVPPAAAADRDMSVPQTCQDSQGHPVDSGDCELNGPHYVTTLGVPHPKSPPSSDLLLPLKPRDDRTCGRAGMHECGITGRYQSHDSGTPLPEPPPGSYP